MRTVYDQTRGRKDGSYSAAVYSIGDDEVYKVILARYDSRNEEPAESSATFIERREEAIERAVGWVMGVTNEKD